jgi:hypothetical protein
MKKTFCRLIIAISLPVIVQTASAQVLLTDNFTVDSNQNDPNFEIGNGRQGGTASPSSYTAYERPGNTWNHQIGSTTFVGAPDSNYLLLAQDGAVQNNLNLSTTATGPLSVSFTLYNRGSRDGELPTYWGAFTLQAAGVYPFPVVGAGEFGILNRENGGIQAFDGSGNITPAGWDTAGFATNTQWTFIFTDTAGIGSAFNGNGSKVTIMNGVYTIGTLNLAQLSGANLELGFRADAEGDPTHLLLIGVDNLSVAPSLPPAWLPFVVQDISPANVTTAVGSNVVFTAAFSNSPPVSLQWQQVVSGSPNVTNNINTGVVTVTNNEVVTSTLTLNNVQPASAASYQLVAVNATNSAAVVYTTAAPLTVVNPITWYPAGTYNSSFSDNSVLAFAGPVGNEVYGVDFGGEGFLTTGNGYVFDDYVATGNMSIAGSVSPSSGYLSGGGTTGDDNLDVILNFGVTGTAADTGTLNNLTIGQAYTVLVLLADIRTSGANGPNFNLTDGLTSSPTQRFAFLGGIPAVGGFIMGTFTAKATNQPLTVLQNGNAQYVAVLLEKGIAPPPLTPPTFTTDIHPLVSQLTTGAPVTLSVAVTGSLPLYYHWFNQGGLISGVTNASYSFNALAGTNSYFVTVSNSVSNIVSSTAMVIAASNIVSVQNFSFEDGTTGSGNFVFPVMWTPFNDVSFSGVGNDHYTPNNPLAPPADGSKCFQLNEGPGDPTGGIYQDLGPLKTNTIYTLTVAIGRRDDFNPGSLGSPGIISLINGIDNNGTILASTNGIPDTVNTWQDYSVTFATGSSVNGDLTVALAVAGASTFQANFDNVRVTMAPGTNTQTTFGVINPSFEANAVASGSAATFVPTAWTAFNQGASGDIGSQNAGGVDYTIHNPLAPTADANQFLYINMFNSAVAGGIYQDVGALETNTTYTLTVAIGSRADRINSPGIISLINGANNTGTVLASGGGLPATQDTWQDYTVSFTTGTSVSGDLTVTLSVAGASSIQGNFDNVRLTKTVAVLSPTFSAPKSSGTNLIVTANGGAPNAGYTLLTTTNLSTSTTWTTNSAGTLDGSGALSNAIPIGPDPVRFYRLRVP